jgi:hypothetical protein
MRLGEGTYPVHDLVTLHESRQAAWRDSLHHIRCDFFQRHRGHKSRHGVWRDQKGYFLNFRRGYFLNFRLKWVKI